MPKETCLDISTWSIPGRRLLVRQESAEEMSEGGIILPEVAQRDVMTSIIVKVGTLVRPRSAHGDSAVMASTASGDNPQVGDRVLCSKDALRSGVCNDVFGKGFHIITWETADGDDGDVLAIQKKGTFDVKSDTTEI